MSQLQGSCAAGAVEQMTMDSLLLPWDPASHRPVRRQGRTGADVLEFSEDGHVEDTSMSAAERASACSAAHGPKDSHEHQFRPQEHAGARAEGSATANPDQRHREAGRALAWEDSGAIESPVGRAPRRASGEVSEVSKVSKLEAPDCLVSECLHNLTKPADLDVHGIASSKAALIKQEPYARHRGPGRPPPNIGAAPVGQAFIDRGPPRASRAGKAPGFHAKARGLQMRSPGAGALRSSGGRKARLHKELEASPSPNSYSEHWYEKKDKSFGSDLRAFHQTGHGHADHSRARPLLPATKYAGITLPVQGGSNAPGQRRNRSTGADASTSSPNTKPIPIAKELGARPSRTTGKGCASAVEAIAKTGAKDQQRGASKRRALQHGRPQLAGAGARPSEHHDSAAYGRVTVVPGLALLQPASASVPLRRGTADEDVFSAGGGKGGDSSDAVAAPSIGSEAKAGCLRALVTKPSPADFAGAGGGRASVEVLAMTAPNLLVADAQVCCSPPCSTQLHSLSCVLCWC